jgi:hypothetical protein
VSVASSAESLGGSSLDGRLVELRPDAPPPAVPGRGWRRLLEWSGRSAPVAVLLLTGMALGPNGIAVLSTDTLSLLAPAVPVAVGVLGVLVGLSVGTGRTDHGGGVLAASLVVALVTLIVVAAGMAALARADSTSLTRPLLVVIAGAGLCAASSLTLPTGNPLEPRTAAVRLIELEVLVPILLGSGMVAWLHAGSPLAAAIAIAQASGLIGTLALAAWLLLTVAANETEERVLTVSALLLVGGVADALATSALFGGVLAGALWRYADGRALESIGRDVQFVQHPLLVGLLLMAGASAELSGPSLAYGALYVVCRVAGRLAGVIAARRIPHGMTATDVSPYVVPPGVFGVALALNAAGVIGADASVLLGAVVLGTVGSELAAPLLAGRRTAG